MKRALCHCKLAALMLGVWTDLHARALCRMFKVDFISGELLQHPYGVVALSRLHPVCCHVFFYCEKVCLSTFKISGRRPEFIQYADILCL